MSRDSRRSTPSESNSGVADRQTYVPRQVLLGFGVVPSRIGMLEMEET